jgi:hypothetical protein
MARREGLVDAVEPVLDDLREAHDHRDLVARARAATRRCRRIDADWFRVAAERDLHVAARPARK